MLAEPKKGGTAKGIEYHEEEAYFQIGADQGIFYGKLAEELGFLDQPMSEETIFAAHQGQSASGEQLVQLRKSELDNEGLRTTSFTDLTFGADKSISLAYEVALRENPKLAAKIAECFQSSVKDALDYVESEYMYCRTDEKSQPKMLSAVYFHHESRSDKDGFISPHLHAHALAMSITQDENGKYRKMENFPICKNHKYIGLIQRAALAKHLQSAGIEIEITDAKKGLFGLKDFKQEHREIFSGRHEMLHERKAELKKIYPYMKDSRLEEIAKVQTRNWKDKTIDREKIRDENIERAHNFNYDLPQASDKSVLKPTLTSSQVLSKAIQDITEKQSVFADKDLKIQALKIGLDQGIVLADIKNSIEHNINLVKTRHGYTTREMILIEEDIFKHKSAKNSAFQVTNTKDIIKAIQDFEKAKGFELKNGQVELVHAALNSKEQIIIAQGVAGAGKTTSFEIAKAVCDAKGRKIIGLAPQGSQKDTLQKESRIESHTVASFLLKQPDDLAGSIIVVDECGMLGTRDMHKLINIAKNNDCKIILSGDINQKKSIQQGDIMGAMQRGGFKTVHLQEGNRQKTEELKIAVAQILSNDISSAILTIQSSKKDEVVEIADRDARLLKAKDTYLQDPQNSLLMVRTNENRRELNIMIRDELVDKGTVTQSKTFQTREMPSMDNLERRQAMYYQLNQTVFLSTNIGKISAGREAKIIEIDKDNNTLILEHENKTKKGTQMVRETVNLSHEGEALNVYKDTTTELGEGETIIFKKIDKKLKVANGELGTILNIKGDKITAKVGDKTISFTTKQYPYLQYGYAITDCAAQGKSIDHAIMLSDQVNKNDWYTQITRAKYKVTVITSNVQNLIKSASKEAIKMNALEETNISTLKQLKSLIKGEKVNGRINRAIAQSATAAINYHRGSRITLKNLARTIKRFAESSGEQWRKSSLFRAFTSNAGVKQEFKEFRKGINQVQNELHNKENTLTSQQGEERQMTINPTKELEVHQAGQNDDEEYTSSQLR